jgi:hypothetical protein
VKHLTISEDKLPIRISKSEHPFGAGPFGIPFAIRGKRRDATSGEVVALGAGVAAGEGACALTAIAPNKASERLRILILKPFRECVLYSIANKTIACPGKDRQ